MKWRIGPGIKRCDIFFFSGMGFAGDKWHTAIRGGEIKRGGDVPGHMVRSIGIVSLLDTRFIFRATADDTDWESQPWRVVDFIEEETFITGEKHIAGPHKRAVHLPDLDLLHHVAASRVDHDNETSFTQVPKLADGHGWTFGWTPTELKRNVRMVEILKR